MGILNNLISEESALKMLSGYFKKKGIKNCLITLDEKGEVLIKWDFPDEGIEELKKQIEQLKKEKEDLMDLL